MKKYLLDVLKAFCLWLGLGLITQLCNLFFGWMMSSWAHWLIVLFSVLWGFGFLNIAMGTEHIGEFIKLKTPFGNILSAIAVISSGIIATKNLWKIPEMNNIDDGGWTTYICIYGSIFYWLMFICLLGGIIVFYIKGERIEQNY